MYPTGSGPNRSSTAPSAVVPCALTSRYVPTSGRASSVIARSSPVGVARPQPGPIDDGTVRLTAGGPVEGWPGVPTRLATGDRDEEVAGPRPQTPGPGRAADMDQPAHHGGHREAG